MTETDLTAEAADAGLSEYAEQLILMRLLAAHITNLSIRVVTYVAGLLGTKRSTALTNKKYYL